MAAPPLPDSGPPLPQDPGTTGSWAPPPDLLGAQHQQNGCVPAAQAIGGAPPWGSAVDHQAAYSSDPNYAYQHSQQHYYSQPQYQQYNPQDPYAQQYQQQYWDPSQSGTYAYQGYGAQAGYGAQYSYPPQQQQQQHYAVPGQKAATASNPYAQMYGQSWSQAAQQGAYAMHQQPQAGPPSGYVNPQGAPSQQSNPYGTLYGGPQAPSQQAHVPWAASPGHAPAQQPGAQAPLPADPPLPGEPPLPQQPPLANGRTHQVVDPFLDEPLHVPLPDALELIQAPGRSKRPKRIAIVLRGPPGSGKSHIARKLRDAEVAAGGEAPRIHSIDDYFITEIDKEVWEKDASGKRKLHLVQETGYKYEADMEGPYKASLLKAFQRTVEEACFTFVIVDANNLRFEDFKTYWSAGQRAGYEVYGLQVPERDPKVCHARTIHGRSLEEITEAAQSMDTIPSLYPQLDASSLLHESQPKRKQAGIKEVDMDDSGDESPNPEAEAAAAIRARSRWADLDEHEKPAAKRAKKARAQAAAAPSIDFVPSSLKKRVRWPDEVDEDEEDIGFSIGGASRRQLETVYVLEGLGPPKDEEALGRTFADQVKREHQSEGKSFRDILFGGPKR